MAQHPSPAQWRRSSADVVATVVLFVVEFAASLYFFVLSLPPAWLLFMPTCSDCPAFSNLLVVGVAVMWGGIAITLVITAAGVGMAGARRRRMWVWPALGLVLLVSSFLLGFAVMYAALPAKG